MGEGSGNLPTLFLERVNSAGTVISRYVEEENVVLPASGQSVLKVDAEGNAYVLAAERDQTAYIVQKIRAEGTLAWERKIPVETPGGSPAALVLYPNGQTCGTGVTAGVGEGILFGKYLLLTPPALFFAA